MLRFYTAVTVQLLHHVLYSSHIQSCSHYSAVTSCLILQSHPEQQSLFCSYIMSYTPVTSIAEVTILLLYCVLYSSHIQRSQFYRSFHMEMSSFIVTTLQLRSPRPLRTSARHDSRTVTTQAASTLFVSCRHGKSSVCPKCAEEPNALTEDSYLTEDKDHQTACDFGAVRCHIGCGETLQRRSLAAHLGGDCPANASLCPRCSQRISRHQRPKHNCEKMSKDPMAQKSDLPAKGQNPLTGASDCRFTPLGCTYKGSIEKMKDHEKLAAVAHMSLVLPLLLRIQNGLPAENGCCDYNGESGDEGIVTDCGHHNGGVPASDLISALESRIQVAENIIMVMNREVESSSAKLIAMLEERDKGQRKLQACEAKIADLRCTFAKKEAEVNELHVHWANLEQTSYDGIFLWKISDFTRKCQDASMGRTASLYSPAFYTARYGYKACVRIYLQGDSAGKGTHISLFFAIMKGEYDVLLPWPFKHKVTFLLLDQSNNEHLIDAFRPDAFSASFQRPVNDMNIASGCPLFCPLSKLQSGRSTYVKDDTMFIRCIIETST